MSVDGFNHRLPHKHTAVDSPVPMDDDFTVTAALPLHGDDDRRPLLQLGLDGEREEFEVGEGHEGRQGYDTSKEVFPAHVTTLWQRMWWPTSSFYRYTVLIMSCFMITGAYMAYYSISTDQVSTALKAEFQMTPAQYDFLFSAYSLPNIVLDFFSGVFLDFFGVRLGGVLFASLVLVGNGMVAVAPYTRSYWLMATGRLVFGIGSEAVDTAQNSIICFWFKGHHALGFAMGMGTSGGRLGTFLSFVSSDKIYDSWGGYHAVLWFVVWGCVLSTLCAVVYMALEVRGEKVAGLCVTVDPTERISFASLLALSRNMAFWLFVLVSIAYYNAFTPFQQFSSTYLTDKYGYSSETASLITSSISFSSMVLSPTMGWIVDRVGNRIRILIVANALLAVAQLLLAATSINPIPLFVIQGILFTVEPAAMWPALALIVPESVIGTAFGLASSLEDAGQAATYPFLDYLQNTYQTQAAQCYFFAAMFALAALISIVWDFVDKRTGGTANKI